MILALMIVFVLMQLVPLDRTNPPSTGMIQAPAEVQRVLESSCFDCHSHTTDWPWYAWIAPASFLVVHDVDEAREQLNFSGWADYSDAEQRDLAEDIVEETQEGEMPLGMYTIMHPGAKLTAEDLTVLEDFFGAMAASEEHPTTESQPQDDAAER